MKDKNKKIMLTVIEAILLYYWCIFLVNADSYYSPYFVLAVVAVIHRTISISKNIQPNKQNKVLLTIFSIIRYFNTCKSIKCSKVA